MKFRISAVSLSYVVLVLLSPNKSAAVPSYSRQTGLSCASCHYAPPELNAFGRKFKLEGYTFATDSGNQHPERSSMGGKCAKETAAGRNRDGDTHAVKIFRAARVPDPCVHFCLRRHARVFI